MKKLSSLLLALSFMLVLTSCGQNNEQVIIYTTINDEVITHMTRALEERFPDYDIVIEYQSTSKLGAKLLAEGKNTDCDIIFSLAYENLEQLNNAELLADLSSYDTSVYVDDLIVSSSFLPEIKTAGAIIINTEMLEEYDLEKPKTYADLLKPEYKDLISMPNPKASASGYTFVKALVNTWGEEKTFAYFQQLSGNILQFTSGSSAVVNALTQKEAAIGLTLICNAVTAINEGAPLEIVVPDEGAPYCMYGQAIIKGKESKQSVTAVFDFLVKEYTQEHCILFYPEQIFKDTVMQIENYPTNFKYADMSGNTLDEKTRLLEMWPS